MRYESCHLATRSRRDASFWMRRALGMILAGAVAAVLLIGLHRHPRAVEGYSLVRWVLAEDEAERGRWFDHLLATEPAAPRQRRYWARRIGETMPATLEGVLAAETVESYLEAGHGAAAWEALRRLAEGPSRLRRRALPVIARAFASRPETPHLLAAALDDPEEATRYRAALGLYRLEERAAPAEGALLRATADPHPAVREIALYALQKASRHPEAWHPVLLAGLADPSWRVRVAAGACAPALAERRGPAVWRLVRLLDEDPHEEVRARAAWACGRMGRQGRTALPALRAAFADADPAVRTAAREAYYTLRP